MRCFIGIPLEEKTRKKLVEIQEKLEQSKTRMKLVEPKNLHITLQFLGETNPEQLEKTEERIQVVFSPFKIRFTHLNAFPNKNYIKCIWAGVGEGREKLKNLHQQITHKTSYEPHVTLARIKTRPDQTIREIIGKTLNEEMQVKKIQLIESKLGPKGPEYKKVFEHELR